MKQSTCKLAVLAALVVPVMSGPALGQGRVDRHVVFAEENGGCILTAEPTRIHAQREFVILWLVRNECSEDLTVEIGNFTFNGESVAAPLETRASTVPHGKQRTISGMIKADAIVGTYNYSILAGGQSMDPELVVDARQ